LSRYAFLEFDRDYTFFAMQTYDSAGETVLSEFHNHFSPDELACFGR